MYVSHTGAGPVPRCTNRDTRHTHMFRSSRLPQLCESVMLSTLRRCTRPSKNPSCVRGTVHVGAGGSRSVTSSRAPVHVLAYGVSLRVLELEEQFCKHYSRNTNRRHLHRLLCMPDYVRTYYIRYMECMQCMHAVLVGAGARRPGAGPPAGGAPGPADATW